MCVQVVCFTVVLLSVCLSVCPGKVVFLNVAKQFDLLKLKFALITDLDVVRGVAPGSAVPAPGGGVLVWYTALVGGTRGWKLMSYPTGLNEDFTVFVRRCTFPAHVSPRESVSVCVFLCPHSAPSPIHTSCRCITVVRRATMCSKAVDYLKRLCWLTMPTNTWRSHSSSVLLQSCWGTIPS